MICELCKLIMKLEQESNQALPSQGPCSKNDKDCHFYKYNQPERSKREDNVKHCDNCICSCECRVFDIEHNNECPVTLMRCSEHCGNTVSPK
jgi:hypothetical protein